MKLTSLKSTVLLGMLIMPTSAISETQFSLPRAINGVEVLLGVGSSYDESAYKGDENLKELSPTIAIMTENFYMDIHGASYRRLLDKNIELKIFGIEDSLPTESEGVDILSIKSGDSFDLGLSAEKRIGPMRIGALMAVDVTGTHSGYKLELSAGKDVISARSKWGFTVGGRYQDSKRANYFYGVAKDEVLSGVPEYKVDGDFSMFANASYAYQLTKNLGLLVGVGVESISNQAKNSPRTNNEASFRELEAFVGLVWQFPIYNR